MAKELVLARPVRIDWWLPNIWLWANLLSGTPHLLSSVFKSTHNFICFVTIKLPIHEKTENWITSTSHYECNVLLLQNAVVRGTLLGLQYMGKDEGGKGGVVVNIASTAGLVPFTGCPVYVATKHAVIGLTRSFGVRTACRNVDILY